MRATLNALGCPEGELSLSIVDDEEIAAINRDYRGRLRSTNVIAFAMRDGAFSDLHPELLGDVVVSAETCRREAERDGIGFAERLEELFVHGVLHLFGYDHEASPEEEARMWRKTEELMEEIRRDRS